MWRKAFASLPGGEYDSGFECWDWGREDEEMLIIFFTLTEFPNKLLRVYLCVGGGGQCSVLCRYISVKYHHDFCLPATNFPRNRWSRKLLVFS